MASCRQTLEQASRAERFIALGAVRPYALPASGKAERQIAILLGRLTPTEVNGVLDIRLLIALLHPPGFGMNAETAIGLGTELVRGWHRIWGSRG